MWDRHPPGLFCDSRVTFTDVGHAWPTPEVRMSLKNREMRLVFQEIGWTSGRSAEPT